MVKIDPHSGLAVLDSLVSVLRLDPPSARGEASGHERRAAEVWRDRVGESDGFANFGAQLDRHPLFAELLEGRTPFSFLGYLGARRRRTPRTRDDLKVPEDASDRELSDATLRFDLALGVRRRHAPEKSW